MSQRFYVVILSDAIGDNVTRSYARLTNAVRWARTLLSASSAASYDGAPAATVTIVQCG